MKPATRKIRFETWLAGGRRGRMLLHLAAAIMAGHWAFHMGGIVREI
jgi:hypothetical protein